jgi:hypothetical protein
MIGQVPATNRLLNSNNAFANNQINHDETLKYTINGRTIKVKNTTIDFRVIAHECSLSHAVRKNEYLKDSSHIVEQPSCVEQFKSSGMAVTAVFKWGMDPIAKIHSSKICEAAPRTPSVDLKSDPAILQRGILFINSLIPEHHLNPTIHHHCLNVGRNMKQGNLNMTAIKNLESIWMLSMNKKQEEDAG